MKTWWIWLTTLAVLCGCPAAVVCDPTVDDCTDGGGPPPDVCNSRAEALADPQCEIPLTTAANADSGTATKLGFISVGADGGVDSDWYLVKLPTLTPRSLVHVIAGYGAPQTPVNLAVSVVKEDGATALARKIDRHSTGAPQPVDIVFPYSESNTKLLLVLSDEGAAAKPNLDVRNQYAVKVEVMDNPDLNEPNDTTPTSIPLTAGGPGLVGVAFGALATDDDVDKYSFVAPAGRKILYLHITGACLTVGAAVCDTRLFPPPSFRVGYTLFDATGKPVAEGQAANNINAVDLATARLTSGQTYTLSIQGYKPPSTTTVTPGDLRMLYRVDVQFMDDLDLTEPNDTLAQPKVVPLGYGTCASPIQGRLAYVPDPDIFALDLAATANAGVLRYSLSVDSTPGRFPPLALASDRQLRVITQITAGATVGDRRLACKDDTPLCPKGYDGSAQAQSLVEGLCDLEDPPWCTWAERNEDGQFDNLKNMVGAIPVLAHGAVSRYFFFVQDEGNNYADDRVYTLNLCYDADPDDTARAALPNLTEGPVALVENASFPVPVATGEVQGVLTHGYGRVVNNRIDQGEGIRAANDYDAVPTDYDRFELALPAVTMPYDRTWALQWEIDNYDAGVAPGDLALEVSFCTGPNTATGCNSVDRILAFSSDRLQPWYGSGLSSRQVLWKKDVTATSTIVTAEPIGCFCFEPRFMSAGHFIFKVGAVDRISNAAISYKVRESLAAYPPSYMLDGGLVSCPAAGDGGASCQFTSQAP